MRGYYLVNTIYSYLSFGSKRKRDCVRVCAPRDEIIRCTLSSFPFVLHQEEQRGEQRGEEGGWLAGWLAGTS